MGKICLNCKYERKETDTASIFECPRCKAIYAKVEAETLIKTAREKKIRLAEEEKGRLRRVRLDKFLNQIGFNNWKEVMKLPSIISTFLAIIMVFCLSWYFTQDTLSREKFKAQIATVFESRASRALIQMRTLVWYDVVWLKEEVIVNDTLTMTGKIYVPTSWPDTMAKPDSALLNAGITGIDIKDPVFTVEKVYIGDQLISSPVRLELGKTYEFKILLKTRRPGTWRLHASMKVNGKPIYSPAKWVMISNPSKWEKVTIDRSTNNFTPVTLPLQTDVVENIKAIEMPERTVSIKIEDTPYYRSPSRDMRMSLTITNNGDTSIRLGELHIAGIRFMDPAVVRDESGYPDNLLAEEGLTVSDNSPLTPGETRTVTLTATGAEWELRNAASDTDWFYDSSPPEYRQPLIYDLVDLNNATDKRFIGLLFFYDEKGNRQMVEVDTPLIIDKPYNN